MFRSAKGQAMLEYLTYFGVSFTIFIGILLFTFYFQNTDVDQAQVTSLNARATEIQTMFYTFAQMDGNFTQNITIQELVNGDTYDFEILADNLYLTQENLEVIVPLPEITGNTTNKSFTVTVVDGGITLS